MTTLTDEEVERITELGQTIIGSLNCNANETGLPCRTDRFAAIEAMIEYLMTHDYMVYAMSSDGHHRPITNQ